MTTTELLAEIDRRLLLNKNGMGPSPNQNQGELEALRMAVSALHDLARDPYTIPGAMAANALTRIAALLEGKP